MKYDNKSFPPLFVFNVWNKDIIKNNVSVKRHKKKKMEDKEKENKKEKDEGDIKTKMIATRLKKWFTSLVNHIYNNYRL